MAEKILVVDDDPELLISVVRGLRLMGLEVHAAKSAEEALVVLKQNLFDIIVTDARMPGMSGTELLKKIREMESEGGPEKSVVIMTGYADLNAPIEALRFKANDYIHKPFGLEEFMKTIKIQLEFIRKQKEREEYIKKLEQSVKGTG